MPRQNSRKPTREEQRSKEQRKRRGKKYVWEVGGRDNVAEKTQHSNGGEGHQRNPNVNREKPEKKPLINHKEGDQTYCVREACLQDRNYQKHRWVDCARYGGCFTCGQKKGHSAATCPEKGRKRYVPGPPTKRTESNPQEHGRMRAASQNGFGRSNTRVVVLSCRHTTQTQRI